MINITHVSSIHKELAAYQKEELKQQERIDKLKENNADDADIRKQVLFMDRYNA
jgi:tubulin-specific chaperone A